MKTKVSRRAPWVAGCTPALQQDAEVDTSRRETTMLSGESPEQMLKAS